MKTYLMSLHVFFHITFLCKCPSTYDTLERFLSGMRPKNKWSTLITQYKHYIYQSDFTQNDTAALLDIDGHESKPATSVLAIIQEGQ